MALLLGVCIIIDLQSTPFYTNPIPKQGSDKAELRLTWALFWDADGIEEGTL